MARSNSPALIALAAEASALARPPADRVSERKIERWVADGLHPRLDRDWPGGGGSSSGYSHELVELTVEVARAVGEADSLDEAALLLWVRGAPIAEERFRAAYVAQLARVEREMKRIAPTLAVDDVAEAFAVQLAKRSSVLAKRWRRRLRARRERLRRERREHERSLRAAGKPVLASEPRDDEAPVGAVLQSAGYNAIVVALTGSPSSLEGLIELIEATGIAAAARDHLPGGVPIVAELLDSDFLDCLAAGRVDQLADRLAAMTSADIEASRAHLALWRAFARAFTAYARRVLNLPDAFGFGPIGEASDITFAYAVPLMDWVRKTLPEETAGFMPFLANHLPRYEAANRLLDSTPTHLHSSFGPAVNFEDLPEDDQETLTAIIGQFRDEYPTDMDLIDTWSSIPEPVHLTHN